MAGEPPHSGTETVHRRTVSRGTDGLYDGGSLEPRLPESIVRCLVALLATPFLLLAAPGTAHRNLGDILERGRRRSRWWLVVNIAAALLGVGALDWFVDAF